MEEKIRLANKKVDSSERMAAIGETAAMMGHDIRNPLQAITGNIFLAKSDVSSLPESETKNGLSARYYAKPLKPVVKETDIETLINYEFKKKIIPQNIETSYSIDNDSKTILTDSDFLKRILDNLVLNAIQAMSDGGKLRITATKKAGNIIITVEDNVVGISAEAKTKLFVPMFTTKSQGQGFGLPVVKRMTEALDGKISFDSEEGKGTKFTISLPA